VADDARGAFVDGAGDVRAGEEDEASERTGTEVGRVVVGRLHRVRHRGTVRAPPAITTTLPVVAVLVSKQLRDLRGIALPSMARLSNVSVQTAEGRRLEITRGTSEDFRHLTRRIPWVSATWNVSDSRTERDSRRGMSIEEQYEYMLAVERGRARLAGEREWRMVLVGCARRGRAWAWARFLGLQ